MNVHVVISDYESTRILPRLARTLVEGTGWSMSATPNGRADVNFFLIYIDYAERHRLFKATKTAAWFTHFEKGHALKERWWKQAATGVDLRLTSAQMYVNQLRAHGQTVQVRPPIDRETFTIIERERNSVPVVGLSGFVPMVRKGYESAGRKGEWLVSRLNASDLGKQIRLIASGKGWPVRRQETRKVRDLPRFYQGLDVYLCTSLIEGIPMPPLEALACGVPIVIPRGVGLLDELPEMSGIYRYDRGDFRTMAEALEQALDEKDSLDREALRDVTEPYTPENWCGDIQKALERLLYDVDAQDVQPVGQRGVYYVAYGGPARKWAKHSMASFKAYMPGVEVALASTEPLGDEDILIEHPDSDIGARSVKTKIYELAPQKWQYVLYLDADTEIIADISFLYQILEDGWDMFICKNPARFHVITNMVRPDNSAECELTFKRLGSKELLQLNGGVFGFRRNARTEAFFNAWHAEWQRWGKRDQAALLRALWDNPLRLYVLGNEWNTVVRYIPKERTAGILHYVQHVRRWEGLIEGRSDSKEAWRAVRKWEAVRK